MTILAVDDSAKSSARDAVLYMIAHHRYFESPDLMPTTGDYKPQLIATLPQDWVLTARGFWYHATPRAVTLPDSGFKLHISATAANAEQVLAIALAVCIGEQASFKVLRAIDFLCLANSKLFPRAAAHKFITIYPTTTDQFLHLARTLDVKTRGLVGPYILSDKPVNGSRSVFYRFGGFRRHTKLTVQGTKELWALSPERVWIRDKRLPGFHLPQGVVDPLATPNTAGAKAAPLLHGRYEVQRAVAFSNCGGTYVARDRCTGDEVLVKEARPLTSLSMKRRFDAVKLLHREQKVLERLAGLTCIPKPLGCFEEGGHEFSAQQFISAQSFRQFRARDSVMLVPFDGNRDSANNFCHAFRVIGTNLVKAVLAVHRHQIIIGDVSVDNILVDEARNVYLIDFGSAWDRTWGPEADELATEWSTLGFRRNQRGPTKRLDYGDDWFAVGMALFSMLLPVESLADFLPDLQRKFTASIVNAAQLPSWVPAVIDSLIEGQPQVALTILESSAYTTQRYSSHGPTKASTQEVAHLPSRVAATIAGITANLLSTYDTTRDDCLWPSDFKVFETNPLSIAYGACGQLLFLKETGAEVPSAVREWLLAKPLSPADYAPGLYVGLSGIAYTLWKLGYEDKAADLLAKALNSELLYSDWGMFFGAAGCGWVSLQMYLWTKRQVFADKALEIGTQIVRNQVVTENGIAWTSPTTGETPVGLAYGVSGIALFLLYLSRITNNGGFESAARCALEHVLGTGDNQKLLDRLRWTTESNRRLWTPYWLNGGTGIGSVVIRFHELLRDERYLAVARDIARSNYSRFAPGAAQFEGLSGMGEFMLDMSTYEESSEFRTKAAHTIDTILMYTVADNRGIAFPGRYLVRLSADYGYGSAGVGLFLDRFLNGRKRLLHHLEGMQAA
jgi:serine/threonine protein kinase